MKAETSDDALIALQQRCKAQGLVLTASRNAILRALLEQEEARDAVPLLQAAQAHHSQTSIGTVYRFLRELEQRRIVQARAQPHGRTRWHLRDMALADAAYAAGDIRSMVAQVQAFLRALEQLGLAEDTNTPNTASEHFANDPHRTLAALRDIAGRLGYRLLPSRRHLA
jgi:Fur family ferric uptake transcriptional regulator